MPGTSQYPQVADSHKNTQSQDSNSSKSNGGNSQESNTRLTPNEAFWKSRREMYSGPSQEDTTPDERGRS
jgi:hypothetical protein